MILDVAGSSPVIHPQKSLAEMRGFLFWQQIRRKKKDPTRGLSLLRCKVRDLVFHATDILTVILATAIHVRLGIDVVHIHVFGFIFRIFAGAPEVIISGDLLI